LLHNHRASVASLRLLFTFAPERRSACHRNERSPSPEYPIGCVDTRKARRAIDKWVLNSRVLYWLDLGNKASSGQFVLGQPKNSANRKKRHRLPTVAELYPEILKRDKKDDDGPSCSTAEALTRQEPFINQNLADQALAMLTQLLRHGSLSYQGGFCNLATGRLVPISVTM
jgi:PRTRC genetic system ThiF family protein